RGDQGIFVARLCHGDVLLHHRLLVDDVARQRRQARIGTTKVRTTALTGLQQDETGKREQRQRAAKSRKSVHQSSEVSVSMWRTTLPSTMKTTSSAVLVLRSAIRSM